MKVGIITRHAICNYGSILQSYATEKVINNLGYEATIINYIREDEKIENIMDTYVNTNIFFSKNIFMRNLYKIMQGKNIRKMEEEFKYFRKKYLNMTEECNNNEELKNKVQDIDIFCTGSDQVWGKIGNDEFDKNYFLEFAPRDKKCITYAASFGKNKISNNLTQNIKNLTDKYKKILVREKSAVEYLRQNGIHNVELVLDPTLLLDKGQWEKFAEKENKLKKPYILIYQLHHDKKFEKYVKNVEKKLNIPVYRVNPSIYFALKPGKFIYLPTPAEFLGLIKEAECILTDSFHGTVFSILFNKKFVDFIPNVTGTRITSLLSTLGLEDRIINDENNMDIIKNEVDYFKVNNILEKERLKSQGLLREVLNG